MSISIKTLSLVTGSNPENASKCLLVTSPEPVDAIYSVKL